MKGRKKLLKRMRMLVKFAFQKKTTRCWEFIRIEDFHININFFLPCQPGRRFESYPARKNFAIIQNRIP